MAMHAHRSTSAPTDLHDAELAKSIEPSRSEVSVRETDNGCGKGLFAEKAFAKGDDICRDDSIPFKLQHLENKPFISACSGCHKILSDSKFGGLLGTCLHQIFTNHPLGTCVHLRAYTYP